MKPSQTLSVLDLDIWLSKRPHGLGYEAHTHVAPYFMVQAESLPLLELRCARELALHAMTDGHEATFFVEACVRDPGRALGHEVPSASETGSMPLGRLLVTDVRDADGRSLMPAANWAA